MDGAQMKKKWKVAIHLKAKLDVDWRAQLVQTGPSTTSGHFQNSIKIKPSTAMSLMHFVDFWLPAAPIYVQLEKEFISSDKQYFIIYMYMSNNGL